MATTVNKSIYPPPPPFFKLFSCPPPPPGKEATLADGTPHPLPAIFTPPPPLHEPFLKFGEVQSPGYEAHQLPTDVPPLYVERQTAAAPASSSSSSSSCSSSAITAASPSPLSPAVPAGSAAASSSDGPPSSYPDLTDHTLSLRLINRQYLSCYLKLLRSLVPSGDPSLTAPADKAGVHVEARLKELAEVGCNFAALLSDLRPHQANQTLLTVMMKQVERRKAKKAQVERCIEEARTFLAQHGAVYSPGSTDIAPLPVDDATHTTKQEDSKDVSMDIDGDGSAQPAAVALGPIAQLTAFLDTIPQ